MEKYLQQFGGVSVANTRKKIEVNPGGSGLLSLLGSGSKENSQNFAECGWKEREQLMLSHVDIACDRSRKEATARNFTGWKSTSDGKKVYTTFRNGHKVAAEGHEGFKLAKGDEARNNKKKKALSSATEADATTSVANTAETSTAKRKRKLESTYDGNNKRDCNSQQSAVAERSVSSAQPIATTIQQPLFSGSSSSAANSSYEEGYSF